MWRLSFRCGWCLVLVTCIPFLARAETAPHGGSAAAGQPQTEQPQPAPLAYSLVLDSVIGGTVVLMDSVAVQGSADSLLPTAQPAQNAADQETAPNAVLLEDGAVVPERHSPTKAAWRAAVLPGWGQIYNKKYWKLPLVYGGLGGLGYWVGFNAVEHRQFRRSYIAKTDETSGFTDPFPALPESSVLAAREYYRRQLDASILLTVAFYGLQIVDAVVDAHLFDFDVSDDLSLQAAPWLPVQAYPGMPGHPAPGFGTNGLESKGHDPAFPSGYSGAAAAAGWSSALPSPQAAGITLTLYLR